MEGPDSFIADSVRFKRGIPTGNPKFEQEKLRMLGVGELQPQSGAYNNHNIPPGDQHQQGGEPLTGYDELRRRNREGSVLHCSDSVQS